MHAHCHPANVLCVAVSVKDLMHQYIHSHTHEHIQTHTLKEIYPLQATLPITSKKVLANPCPTLLVT